METEAVLFEVLPLIYLVEVVLGLGLQELKPDQVAALLTEMEFGWVIA